MDQRLTKKVAIITGAGSTDRGNGVGSAISITFAKHGCKVLLVDKNQEHAENTASAIRDVGGESVVCNADVTKISDAEKMVDLAISSFGRLDILVNNVGILGLGDVTNVEEENWDNVLDTNLKSMMLTSKYAIPKMIHTGGGSIINISSDAGLKTFENFYADAYVASKAAIIMLTKSWALEYACDNIRVNCICASVVDTDMTTSLWLDTEIKRKNTSKAHPLGRIGTGKDIAYASLYFASDDSSWTTGAVLPVDGGVSIK